MARYLILVAVVLCSLSLATAQKKKFDVKKDAGRIVGGKEVDIKQYPYQCAFGEGAGNRFYQYCGCSIIENDIVVTAAHCFINADLKNLHVRVGSSRSNSGGEVIKIIDWIIHERYNKGNQDNDIAVCQLAKQVPSNWIIPLATAEPKDGAPLFVTGWGHTKEHGKASQQLLGVMLPTISRKKCRDSYGETAITNNMICAGYPKGEKDACQGDSGGPIVTHQQPRQLVGVVSWGMGCARENSPGVYASVPALSPWIKASVSELHSGWW